MDVSNAPTVAAPALEASSALNAGVFDVFDDAEPKKELYDVRRFPILCKDDGCNSAWRSSRARTDSSMRESEATTSGNTRSSRLSTAAKSFSSLAAFSSSMGSTRQRTNRRRILRCLRSLVDVPYASGARYDWHIYFCSCFAAVASTAAAAAAASSSSFSCSAIQNSNLALPSSSTD